MDEQKNECFAIYQGGLFDTALRRIVVRSGLRAGSASFSSSSAGSSPSSSSSGACVGCHPDEGVSCHRA